MSTAGHDAIDAGRQILAELTATDALRTAADELVAVKQLLAEHPALRRVLIDPGRAPADRTGFAEQVLGGKIAADTLRVVSAVVGERLSSPSDLLTSVEELAVDALLALGAAEGVLAEVEDELFRFTRIVDADPDLSGALSDSTVDSKRRARLAHTLLSGRANDITISLVEIGVAGFGGRGFDAAMHRLLDLTAARREQRIAYVTVAAPLGEEAERRLAAKLTLIYGQTVSVKTTIDASIIGGIRVQIGHDLYDGSVARRLTEARHALTRR